MLYNINFSSAYFAARFLTLNSHLHLHLNKVYKDFGPYWLFSFEHYNGLLGQCQTNHRAIEIQLMQKFISDMHIKSIANSSVASLTSEQKQHFKDLPQTSWNTSAFTETVYGLLKHY